MAIRSITRALSLATLILLSTVPAAPTAYAAPWYSPKSSEPRPVRFYIENTTDQPVTLHSGLQQFSIKPHGTITVRILAADPIVLDTSTPKLTAGSVVLTVFPQIADGTVIIE